MSESMVRAISLHSVQPHPKTVVRFEYKVEPLATLIKSAVSDDTPNGQLEPGRVVPRNDGKEGYWVYIGVKRYFALKLLLEQTREERFATFNAYVDRVDSPLLQLFIRAKIENEEERGEREDFSILEEISGIDRIKDSLRPDKLDADLKRLYDISGKLSQTRLRKLYEVERAAGFRFRLGHLEGLCVIENERDFALASAATAGFQFPEDKVDDAMKGMGEAYVLRWFGDVFPEYEKLPGSFSTPKTFDTREPDRRLVPHERDVFIVLCPACGAGNLSRLRLRAEVTSIPVNPGGEESVMIPEALIWFASNCHRCGAAYYTFVQPVNRKTYTVGASLSSGIMKPKETVDLFDIDVDFKTNAWRKITDEGNASPLDLPQGLAKKARKV